MRKMLVSVIGGHKCDEDVRRTAFNAGRIIAGEKAVLVTGGLGGVMQAACEGAKASGGLTLGIIPGEDPSAANESVDIVLPTGMGFSRNTLVASVSDIVVALPGEYGTLSEIGFALNAKKKVFGLGSWDIKGVKLLENVEQLKELLKEGKTRYGGY